jgi:hypothetical protein
MMSTAVINSLRNTRRERRSLVDGYRQADQLIVRHFGNSNYVTGQLASLDVATGVLTWINAGHLLPLLVRNGTYAGELQCEPSMPMGLGGPVVQVAQETLQRGDRVLFHTDGITESVSPSGGRFGLDRLADYLVRATLDGVPGAETVRRLSAAVGAHVGRPQRRCHHAPRRVPRNGRRAHLTVRSVGFGASRAGEHHVECGTRRGQVPAELLRSAGGVAGEREIRQGAVCRCGVVAGRAVGQADGHHQAGSIREHGGQPQQPCRIAGRQQFAVKGGVHARRRDALGVECVPCRRDPLAVAGVASRDGSFERRWFQDEPELVDLVGFVQVDLGDASRPV